jgi:3-deoxy-D-manno-octulosonic-acid transferase
MSAPLLYKVYCAATAATLPFAARREVNKVRAAGLPVLRAHEKLGHASDVRAGSGPLVWFHAPLVEEDLSVPALITRMGEMLPRAQFLLTSGTPTSADLVARRMPPRTVHQFAPLDAKGPLIRFLDHWRPDTAVFAEGELRPQMLRMTHARGARMVLLNARLSDGSRRGWGKRPKTARYLLEVFDLILAQNDEMAQAMVDMNAPADRVARGFDLKSLSDPLPVDAALLAETQTSLGQRPVWVAALTHEGEEQIVLEAQKEMLQAHPDLMLILAPRYPERGDAVADLVRAVGLGVAQRSKGDAMGGQVYLADTLGELGTWYAFSPIVFLGGALKPIGGHNPFAVAQAGAAIVSGPHVFNFSETFTELNDRDALITVADAGAIAREISALLHSSEALARARHAAVDVAQTKSNQLDIIATRLIRALDLEEAPR